MLSLFFVKFIGVGPTLRAQSCESVKQTLGRLYLPFSANMRYFTTFLLLAAAAVAAPAPITRRGGKSHQAIENAASTRLTLSPEIAVRAPIAEAFATTFPGFTGKSQEDVDKFLTKGAQVTAETTSNAAKWKRDAIEAGDEADYAIKISKRSLHIKKQLTADETWIEKETVRADELARKAEKLKRKIVSSSEDVSLRREANALTEELAETYATLAYAREIRSSSEDVEFFTTRDQSAAEMAMGKERRVKRESFFQNKAARKREAVHEQAVKLRAEFEVR